MAKKFSKSKLSYKKSERKTMNRTARHGWDGTDAWEAYREAQSKRDTCPDADTCTSPDNCYYCN